MPITTEAAVRRAAQETERFSPAADGWDSEAWAEASQNHWRELAAYFADPNATSESVNDRWIADEFESTHLRPPAAKLVFQQPCLTVRRWTVTAGNELTTGAESTASAEITSRTEIVAQVAATVYRGRTGWAQALAELATGFAQPAKTHVHFKTTEVSMEDETISARVLMELDGVTAAGRLQRKSQWHCEWRGVEPETSRLVRIRLLDWEEAISSSGPWLSDCTTSVIGRDPAFTQQLQFGLDYWLRRIERVHRMDVYTRQGLAVGDVNGDHLDDVYLCQPGGLPNRLFIQQADGTAVDQAASAGVDWLDRTSSALLLDLDNDGDADLVVATHMALVFLENDGQGQFAVRFDVSLDDHDPHSMAAADYDNDGDLDLYVCVEFAQRSGQLDQPAFVYHDANDGGRNVLLRNDIEMSRSGEWQFTDVTAAVGLDQDNRRHSLAAAWEDFDNDGDQDLYVANDYGQNCLYENRGGRFRNVADQLNVVDYGSGMSVSWADVDHDGRMDLYVGNMFSSAGNRVTRQTAFQPAADTRTRDIYRRFAKGNSLFLNRYPDAFEDAGGDAAVEMARWAWASLFVDLNNDSWDDIVVANGYITGEDTDDL